MSLVSQDPYDTWYTAAEHELDPTVVLYRLIRPSAGLDSLRTGGRHERHPALQLTGVGLTRCMPGVGTSAIWPSTPLDVGAVLKGCGGELQTESS